MSSTEIVIKKMSPALKNSFLHFFDDVAFVDNPAWGSCYCEYYHTDEARWAQRTKEENRASASTRIECDRSMGHLAFLGDEPVAWINMAANDELPGRVERSQERVAVILCFLVAPEQRRRGLAKRLLAAGVDYLFASGFDVIEGHPAVNATSAASLYHGSRGMFADAGFAVHSDDGKGKLVMRRRR